MRRRNGASGVDEVSPFSEEEYASFESEHKGRVGEQDDGESPGGASLVDVIVHDGAAFAVLVLLYTIQGLPLGIVLGSLSFLLKKSFSYASMGVFSLAAYPYSLKVLWAPLVDAFSVPAWGRRKTWIVPMQTVSGLIMIGLSFYQPLLVLVDGPHVHGSTAGGDDVLPPGAASVGWLMIVCFVLVMVTATQDIAVDGLAITQLKPRFKGYASTCQSIGLNIGYFTAFTVFLALHAPSFCNAYLRSPDALDDVYGLWTFAGFIRTVGILYLVATAVVVVFVTEKEPEEAATAAGGSRWAAALEIYRVLMALFTSRNFLVLVGILLTIKIGFVADNAVTALKLMDAGLETQDLALVAVIAFPFSILFAMLAGRWASRPNPFGMFMRAWGARLALVVANACVVYNYPKWANPDGSASGALYLLIVVLSLASSLSSSFMFVCMGAFFARIADERVGGTYLTVLNTLSNLGGTWPKAPLMASVEYMSVGGVDGYFVIIAVSVLVAAVLAGAFIKPQLARLSLLHSDAWLVDL